MSLDIRIDASFTTHPKRLRLQRELGPGAVLGLIDLWAWAATHRPDGDLSGMAAEDLARAVSYIGDAQELVGGLVRCRFLDGEADAFRIHDWADHQPWVVGARERSECARAAARTRWAMRTVCEPDARRMPSAHADRIAPSPTPSPENPESHQNGIPPGLAASAEAPTTTRPVEGSRGAIGPARVIDAWNAVAKEQRWRTSSSAESSVKKVRAALARREFREAWEADLSLLRSRGLPFVGQPGEHQNWRPSLEWFVRADTHAAIADGRYWQTDQPPLPLTRQGSELGLRDVSEIMSEFDRDRAAAASRKRGAA